MKYGCIGERLGHSFSKVIHSALADYEYELFEISSEKLPEFFEKRDFLAINVTIPYKEKIIPYLDHIDGFSSEIGAVNTVVNRGGKLYGYNTDFFGLSELIAHTEIEVMGKKAAILGTGGTSKTAYAVLKSLGAKEIIKVSRRKSECAISYEELYSLHSDTEVIINTTPVGMFPNAEESPIDLSPFAKLIGVIDVVYNPLRTKLILDAKEKKIAAEGGLYMLVAQAVLASEYFFGAKYPDETLESVYKKFLSDKENIVLTGMPASGKSTIGKRLAKELSREFYDTDIIIEEKAGMKISDIFLKFGEKKFRELEAEVINLISSKSSTVIATGGGAILKDENLRALRKNGRIYFIDRPPEELIPTKTRPLASDREAIMTRYRERYERYISTSDVRIDARADIEGVTALIKEDFLN